MSRCLTVVCDNCGCEIKGTFLTVDLGIRTGTGNRPVASFECLDFCAGTDCLASKVKQMLREIGANAGDELA